MNVNILQVLSHCGLTPVLQDGRLKLRGHKNAITLKVVDAVHAHRPELLRWCQSLDYFRGRAQNAQTLDELSALLLAFSRRRWSLIERADMSATYTPRALKLIGWEDADKWRSLEALAVVCWDLQTDTAGGDAA